MDPVTAAKAHGIDVKEGQYRADIEGITQHMVNTFEHIARAFQNHAPGVTPTITSGTEEAPGRLEDSLHYSGNAIDIRDSDLSQEQQNAIISELRGTLGPDYDFEDKSNHIHIEYDPD